MLNFRKLKKDYSPTILKQGKTLFDQKMVDVAQIVRLDSESVTVSLRVGGKFENFHDCVLEVDRSESMMIDSECNCPYQYDCQHLAAAVFHLEEYLDKLIIKFAQENEEKKLEGAGKDLLIETIEKAKTNECERKDKELEKELLYEYQTASTILAHSPYFFARETVQQNEQVEMIVFLMQEDLCQGELAELQLALQLPYRSKPLFIPDAKLFLDSVRYQETFFIGSKRFCFSVSSFTEESRLILEKLLELAVFHKKNDEKNLKSFFLNTDSLGILLAHAQSLGMAKKTHYLAEKDSEDSLLEPLPTFFQGNLERPLRFSRTFVRIKCILEYLEIPHPKVLLKPKLLLKDGVEIDPELGLLFTCKDTALLYQGQYYRFPDKIKRQHLQDLLALRKLTVPEPLFGTFVENALPELERYAEVTNKSVLNHFVTMPFTKELRAICDLTFDNKELYAKLTFLYDGMEVPSVPKEITPNHMANFVTDEGILARNLSEEQIIIEDLFQDFEFEERLGIYKAKSNKKVVEFMTEVVPSYSEKITFNSPENLRELFIYDDTHFELDLKELDRIDTFEVTLKVHGPLKGVYVDQLWECLSSHRAFIEVGQGKQKVRKVNSQTIPKILVLDLEQLAPVVQVFDDIGLKFLDDHTEERPLWTLASINPASIEGLPVTLKISKKLLEMQKSMQGKTKFTPAKIPDEIQTSLRNYQIDGVAWVERLRSMRLNGILADDMGLGKTLQAICAITQYIITSKPKLPCTIICPTSLLYNWYEEFIKFHPKLKVLVVDGAPAKRAKLIQEISKYDVMITSYSLLQKDVEEYKEVIFGYVILDEGQYIKNRETRNSCSVKMLKAAHKLILTGTPIENTLSELWSLFDFLMPGLLSTYDRFVEKYVRIPQEKRQERLENLKRKLSPFLLRRLTEDVVKDLPSLSEMVYYCQLTESQKKLYTSYVESARKELTQLVEREGFEKVQIHVLATLTRLKQICCHPAIFAKEFPEPGDSGKYEMLMELLRTLFAGGHRVVLFSQYTQMLKILRNELLSRGIFFEYLDGSTKNRIEIVNRFNSDGNIPLFLVSLKAGGTGLNLVGADVVIHYDMWWSPGDQATKRVHRLGQDKPVSVYKLVTKGTIEENIIAMQERKRGLVKKVIASDEEAVGKLTWEEVLELLQT